MKFRRTLVSLLAGSAVFFNLDAATILDISTENADSFKNEGMLLVNDIAIETTPVQCFNLGGSGVINLSQVTIPAGQFTIESKFFLKDYSMSNPYISDIFSAYTLETEGVDMRVGGGYMYPLKCVDIYNNYQDFVLPTSNEKEIRSSISRAVGEFALGVGKNVWKETFTDRCIERDVWTHMVATWDGFSMQVYLNGYNATDNLRTVGRELPVFINPSRPVTIGAENNYGSRHFNGKISYVKLYGTALSSKEIFDKYKESLGTSRCKNFIKIESPHCGEVITPKTKVKVTLHDSSSQVVNPQNYLFQVDVSDDQNFTPILGTYKMTSVEAALEELSGFDLSKLQGVLFIRVTALEKTGLAKKNEDEPVAQSGIIPTYLTSSTTPVVKTVKKFATAKMKTETVIDCQGRRVNNIQGHVKNGVYFSRTVSGNTEKLLNVR
ncbi:MAG: LamG domain-containing protein [Fibrobacter sp.]|mgnify:CR=1 FL=1|nr:LamG domain-containing protein [Fibrobacter sp.]